MGICTKQFQIDYPGRKEICRRLFFTLIICLSMTFIVTERRQVVIANIEVKLLLPMSDFEKDQKERIFLKSRSLLKN